MEEANFIMMELIQIIQEIFLKQEVNSVELNLKGKFSNISHFVPLSLNHISLKGILNCFNLFSSVDSVLKTIEKSNFILVYQKYGMKYIFAEIDQKNKVNSVSGINTNPIFLLGLNSATIPLKAELFVTVTISINAKTNSLIENENESDNESENGNEKEEIVLFVNHQNEFLTNKKIDENITNFKTLGLQFIGNQTNYFHCHTDNSKLFISRQTVYQSIHHISPELKIGLYFYLFVFIF